MSVWKVYSKDGNIERCELHAVEYGGTYMGERAVTATFTSPCEIEFGIFDYIIYRDEKFEIEAIPTVKKVSSFEYIYELRFVSLKYELERCEMRDLVPYDNDVVYPTPLTFSFTGNVRYLTERIQACLDSLYGDGVWNIVVGDGVESEEKNVTIAQQNCWNALALVYSIYGLDFHIKGRTITIGETLPLVDHVFEYGKGNGLYEIERASDTDTGIVTKLRAFGGTRNLDYSYPKRPEWTDSVLPVSFAFSPLRLMLPSFKYDGKTDYILADEESIAKYGIRESSVIYEDIYPSITGATHNGQAIDQIKSVEAVDDNSGTFVVYLYDLGFDLEEHLTTSDAQISMKTGAMQGYTFTIASIEKQEDGSNKTTLNRVSAEGGENYNIPNSDWNMKTGDEFVLLNILMPQKYIRDAEERLETRAKEYLVQYSKTNFSYNIGLHDKFLLQNSSIYDSLTDGAKLSVYDEELGINEKVTIQSITITENAEDNILPQVKVTLNNQPSASTLDRIQGKIESLANETAAGSFATQSEIMAQYRKKLDKPYFDKLFVAIDKEGNEIASNDITTPVAYIKAKYDFAVVGGVTMYATDKDLDIPSIYDGLPLDNDTIYWEEIKDEEGNVIGKRIKTRGGSGEGGITPTLLGDLTNVGAWANGIATEDRIMVQRKDSASWVALNLSEIGGGSADFSNVLSSGNGNAFTSFVLSEDKNTLTFVKGQTFALQTELDKKWTTDSAKIASWNTAYGWGDHSKAGYLKKEVIYDESIGCWKLDGDLLVTGGITMFANDGTYTPSNITDAVNIDNQTIIRQNGVLMVNPDIVFGGGGGEVSSVAWDNILGKPTTISGYGITDAKISNGVITLGGNSITPLTSHQTIYNLTLRAGTFSAATFDPNGGAKTVYIPTTTSHVSEGSNLYFTNARAISALSDTLKAYVTLSGTQTITGEKDFTGGLKVNGSPIVYDKTKKYWKFEGDLLVTGGITMYGLDGSSFGTIWDNAPIATTSSKGIASFDPNYFSVSNGYVTFIGQTGGGTADSVTWGNVTGKPSWITTTKPEYQYTEIKGTPDLAGYVTLSGNQTITGEKTFESSIKIKRGFSILDDQGWGIVGVNSTGWTGLPEDGSAIGFGTGAAPVYIRTSGDDLYHYDKNKDAAYKIIDSNNIVNYKVGDSIKFNGFSMRTDSAFENKAVDANINYIIDATSLSTSYFYPVIFPCSLKDLYVRMYSTSGSVNAAYNQNKLEFTFRGQGWMDAPNGLTVHFYSCYDAKETTIGCIAMGEAQGYKVVWVRGGLTYYVTSNITPTLYKDGVTFINEKYSYGVNFYGGTNTNVKVYWTPQATSGLGAMYHSGSIGTYGSLNVKGISIYKSDKGYLFIDGDLVVKGGITMYGTDGTAAPTIWDGAPKATTSNTTNGKGVASFDSKFFSVSNGHVTFIGDVGGLDESALATYLSNNKYLTQTTGDARYLAIGGNAVSAGMVKGGIVSNGNSATNTNKALVYYSEIPSTATNIPTSRGYQNSILSLGLHSNGATAQLFFSASQSLYYRPNVSTNWNEIAYTTSNVASATTASKLSTVSKTAWGQTYWTSDGVPTSISGDMTGVGSISMNGTLTGATSLKINVPITYLSNFKLGSLGTSSNIAIHHSNQFGVYGMVDYNSGAFALQAAYQTTPTALDILLQPRGGNVAIGKTSATCALDVNGANKGTSGSFSGNVSMGGATVNGNLNLGASGLLLDSNNSYGNSSWIIFTYGPTLQFKYGNQGSTPSTMGLQISKADGSITTYGEIKHPNATKFCIANNAGSYKGIMSMDAANNFCLGYDSSASSYDTYIDGFNMHFRTGNAHSEIFTLGSAGGAKLYLKTAALIIKRNHSSGGAYTQYQPCNQENRSWSAGVNNSYQYSWWYQNVSSGIDVQKMYLDSSGNLLTTGGITMYSDIRKKTILNHVELSLKEVADAPLIEHYYNSDEAKTIHVGSVAQYWAGLNDWFCKEDGEGFLTMEIQNAALASAISVARELTRYESKTDKQIKKLKKRIGELEEEIENLKNK